MTAQMCHIPSDLVVNNASFKTLGDLWHRPDEIWDKINAKATGEGTIYANLDTGYTPHPNLPKPIAERSFIRGESVRDGNGHGCHTIGTSVGRSVGLAPNAKLIVGKVLSDSGSGSSDGIAQAVRWAVNEGADVINLSIGGGGFYEPMRDAILYALENGCLVNAAAGNSGYNGANSIDFPGKYFESLCNGAYRSDGSIAGFSSGGREMDWACPGQDIVSTSHRGSGFVSMSGTSMATPFGSGLLLLVIELMRREGHATKTGIDLIGQIRDFLGKYSIDAGQEGVDDRFGRGVPKSTEIVTSLAADDMSLLAL